MPRKPKFTKEDVLNSAYEVAKRDGFEAITAQSVAKNMGYTGSSLFTHFGSMDEIKAEVYLMAKKTAEDYLRDSINYQPAFKMLGMKWVHFAKDEPNLYRMIFSGSARVGKSINPMEEFDEIFQPMYREVMKEFDMDYEDAREVMNQCVIHVNGIATFVINQYGDFNEERIGKSLSEVCQGVAFLMKLKKGTLTEEFKERLATADNVRPVRKI